MQKIYCLEDDDNIRELVCYALSSSGFEAIGFSEPDGFFKGLDTLPDLLLLDIMLPGMDGITILKKLRADSLTKDLAVIMLTAKGSEYDRVSGLDLGADDYVVKPFSVLELISRVKAVLRRKGGGGDTPSSLEVGSISLNAGKHTVLAGGKEIQLTYKEFELLSYLMVNEGIVLTREKLMDKVWGFDYEGESRTVDMHIKSLRQKLEDSGDLIKTIRGVGYKIGG